MMVTGPDVADFLGQGDDADVVALAWLHVPLVTAIVRTYTRNKGFTSDGPSDSLAAVIITASARLITNPAQAREERIGDYAVTPATFDGFTLPELMVLNTYRKRST